MQFIDALFEAGARRIQVPVSVLFASFLIPTWLLALMITNEKMPTPAKQVVSIPLLAAIFITPIIMSCGNRFFDVMMSPACYCLFLRLFEFYWISPILYHKQAYATRDYVYREFWSSLRKFPKPSKKNGDDNGDGREDTKAKVYVKNKRWYHLVLYFIYHALICDVLGSWLATFTGNEVITMRYDRPGLYVVFTFFAVYLLSNAFSVIGYALHLLHCLFYDHGSYSDEQWHPLINNPVISTSLEELWNIRWHQLFHTSWVAFAFRPARYIIQRTLAKAVKNPLPIALFGGTIAVFLLSGLTHEYMVYANAGWSAYSQFFAGQQLFFFFIQGVGMTLERLVIKRLAKRYIPLAIRESLLVKHVVARLWVIGYALLTFPYFINGFAYRQVWHDNPFSFSRPYVLGLLRSIPQAETICGSLL